MTSFICILTVLMLSLPDATANKDQYLCPNNPKCFCKKDNSTMNCSGKKLQNVPADIPRQVERLWLDHNDIIDLNNGRLCNLPYLRELHLENNKIAVIRSKTFTGSCLPSLKDLYLLNNKIAVLEQDAFQNMSALNKTYLTNNYIADIHPEAFSGRSTMTFLHLGGNYLKQIPALGNLVNLQSLSLQANKITNATFPYEYRRITPLSIVGLSNNNIQTLENGTFIYLNGSGVRKLELSRNKISRIDSHAFTPLKKIISLKLGRNPLNANDLAEGLAGLDGAPLLSLDITNLALGGSLPSTTFRLLQRTKLKTLIMKSNKINTIPSRGFSNLSTLETLDIGSSGIYQISNSSFDGMSSLYNLLLNNNNLVAVPRNLPKSLEYLYLNGNQIATLENYAFDGLSKLRKLYLGGNRIQKVYENTFSGLSELRILHIVNNEIGTIPSTLFMPLPNLHSLELGNNNLKFIQGGGPFDALSSLTYLSLADNYCSTIPKNLFNRLEKLKTLRIENNQLGHMIADDSTGEIFSGLTNLLDLYMSNNGITFLPDALFKDLNSLSVLNLTGNSISGWGPYLFAKTALLGTLDLSKNYISLVNKTSVQYFRSMEYLNLSGNPFACTCDLRWFRDWMNTTSLELVHEERYKCNTPKNWKGKPLLSFDRTKIICLWFTLSVLIACVAGGIVFIALVIFLIYYKRWTLRLYLYRAHRHWCNKRTEKGGYQRLPGCHKEYDAYISCSEEDENWVLHNLLPDIDNDNNGETPFNGNFRLYFDPRDKEAGVWIADNITKQMQMSRKVIIVLTNTYLSRDRYSAFELRLAIEMKQDMEIEDIIVIKVGNVSLRRIPKILHFVMEKRKFIEWEDMENAKRTFKERMQDILAEHRTEHGEEA